MYYSTNVQSPLGMLTIASDGENITGLWIEGQKYYLSSVLDEIIKKDDLPVFQNAREWLTRYFAGEMPEISKLPLRPAGGKFRQHVWKILCEIPYGEVVTYGSIAKEVAEKMGRDRMSSQAVGGAVGHNPISIIIPCHRVVGTSGSLTGYAGGIQLKIKLLEHEGVDMSHLFIPKKGTAL
ncbi:methylated-DNA--[protein]-cysteine S-methyltransferase [uncultured Robinsoniella sp.]|uniref:methylated-DNA--[protein]-cysteine S-methyltransferase n=1 Tax=uncultured Robinsoniella sp. TaxID=904190 RepID=UPI00374FBA44